ncbi:hypothetical protein MLD38_027989 [Melastoma candidum]|uniref:Uncharacterized protein n=1 Tax=Melastoma candidum TaxID=119954 RepID=A0ACB9N187_9MYRT|nr:hypothetical protein MLD38_027989 [Melastoma candidum]
MGRKSQSPLLLSCSGRPCDHCRRLVARYLFCDLRGSLCLFPRKSVVSRMSNHLVLCVDHFAKTGSLRSSVDDEPEKAAVPFEASSSVAATHSATHVVEVEGVREASDSEEEPLLQTFECRICQEEDSVKNLETPCGCCGSLKYAHRKCVQHWCNEKGDIICEICHQTYQPGYTAPAPGADSTTIDISEGWTLSGTPLDLRDPRIVAMAAAERHFLESEYDEYADNNASGAAFGRSAALILMAMLLLRHALYLTNGEDDDEASALFSLFLLRAAGFLLPCYVMAWVISILQRRQQRQEAAALAASEVAFMLQTGHRHGLQISIEPGSPVSPHPGSVAPPQLSPASNVVQ